MRRHLCINNSIDSILEDWLEEGPIEKGVVPNIVTGLWDKAGPETPFIITRRPDHDGLFAYPIRFSEEMKLVGLADISLVAVRIALAEYTEGEFKSRSLEFGRLNNSSSPYAGVSPILGITHIHRNGSVYAYKRVMLNYREELLIPKMNFPGEPDEH